jgi:hypothetical protein
MSVDRNSFLLMQPRGPGRLLQKLKIDPAALARRRSHPRMFVGILGAMVPSIFVGTVAANETQRCHSERRNRGLSFLARYLSTTALVAVLAAIANHAHADCGESAQGQPCLINGEPGTYKCVANVGYPICVANPNPDPPPPVYSSFSLQGMEVTQAIQDMQNSVTLIAGKTTWVRAYLSGPAHWVTADLQWTRSDGTSGTISGGDLGDRVESGDSLKTRRKNFLGLDFKLPPPSDSKVTEAGTVTFQLVSVRNSPFVGPQATLARCDQTCAKPTVVTFRDEPPLRVKVIGLVYKYAPGPSPFLKTFAQVRTVDYALIQSWLARAYPVSSVSLSRTEAISIYDWPFDCHQANAQVLGIRGQDMGDPNFGFDARTHYYGVVPDEGGFSRGCAQIRLDKFGNFDFDTPDSSNVASGWAGPTGQSYYPFGLVPMPRQSAGDTDASYGDFTAGHELAHTLGRKHPGFCYDNDKDDQIFRSLKYPNGQLIYPDGQIGDGSETGYAGFDVGDLNPLHVNDPDPKNSIPLKVLWPYGQGLITVVTELFEGTEIVETPLMDSAFDIMTYCHQPEWPSAYTYEGIRKRLEDENNQYLPNNPIFVPLSFSAPTAQLPSTSNPSPIAMLTGAMVHVVATVNLTHSTGAFEFVTPVQRAEPQIGATDRASLVVRDGAGRQLSSTPVVLRGSTDTPSGADQTALISGAVPFNSAMAEIDLVLDHAVLVRYRNATKPPTAPRLRQVFNAIAGAPGAVAEAGSSLAWTPPAAAEGTVTYTVQTSSDGKTWSTIAIGLKEPNLALTPDHASAGTMRVIANNGFRSAAPVVIKLQH